VSSERPSGGPSPACAPEGLASGGCAHRRRPRPPLLRAIRLSALVAAALLAPPSVPAAHAGGAPGAKAHPPVRLASTGGTPTVLEQSTPAGDYAAGGYETCTTCHDQAKYVAILRTPHGMKGDARTPFAKHACQTCHGPGAAHVDNPGPFPPLGGKPNPAANAVCLGCHRGGQRIHWDGSEHEAHGLACTSCHKIHEPDQGGILATDVRPGEFVRHNQTETCYRCHPDVRAQSYLMSAHPIKQGRVVCTDCHNPHGSMTDHLLKQETLNETCYQCHADKRGPFLWEHEPARENCLACHLPHGSVHANLLKARLPWLCQECHMSGFHPSTAYTGSGLPGFGTPQRALLLNSCTNCHTNVHGSNSPSGVRFTR
jgi:DmsE family decaheme c-type cytochrome